LHSLSKGRAINGVLVGPQNVGRRLTSCDSTTLTLVFVSQKLTPKPEFHHPTGGQGGIRDGGEYHHHGIRSAKSEETKHRDNDDHETDDIDNVVHAKPPCNGMMPVRHG
jgi:hypothetical protein